MPRLVFAAFYPSRPFWAVSKVDFQVPHVEGRFYDQMVEEVYSSQNEAFALKLCRDGRILIHVASLELDDTTPPHTPIEKIVRRWGKSLDFLNAFYLLLDSATIEIDKLWYFNLHEITNRDAFRVAYENGKATKDNIPMESIASVFQMGRSSGSYPTDAAIEYDPRIMGRPVISLYAISHAASVFQQVVASPGTEKPLASFAKSLAEFKVGNYETSIVLAWFITETAMSTLWESHIDSQNRDMGSGRKRINRQRKDFLIGKTGRDFPISVVSNMLELSGVLDHSLFEAINSVRGHRNDIVHPKKVKFIPGASEAHLALKTAQTLIERLWGIRFTPNFNYSVHDV
jgi:hypothetical protein